MEYLVDTNLLIWTIDLPARLPFRNSLAQLLRRGNRVCIVPQNVYEFWVVATRPVPNNGLGLSAEHAADLLQDLQAAYPVLHDTPEVLEEWRRLVLIHGVVGKSAHDARPAAMRVHRISRILTFNVKDLARYPGIQAIHPDQILTA